MFFFSVAVP